VRASARVLLVLAAAGSFAVACGDRTGLLVDGTAEPPPMLDASLDAPFDVPAHDAGIDARGAKDAVATEEDALPPLDVLTMPDVVRSECVDAGETQIYVITEQYVLYSFYPPTLTFTEIGTIACPTTTPGAMPFSMAVDDKGVAYTVFNDGELFRVSTATAACEATPYVSGQSGFTTFGMGYSGDTSDAGETLYVAGYSNETLATIDPNFVVHPIAAFSGASVIEPELTGTGAGQLFAFYSHESNQDPTTYIGALDKATAEVVSEAPLPNTPQGNAWAFAFWGGNFYVFTSADGQTSNVTEYQPATNSVSVVTTLSNAIIGAGVSTCAPQM
jgi:hypothetical protein